MAAREWHVPGEDYAAGDPELSNEDVTKTLDEILRAQKSARRMGSAMSNKQFARAGVDGRKVLVRTEVLVPIEGYIVGMDDYHLLIAEPSGITLDGESAREHGVLTSLIPKGAAMVTFTDEYLSGELDEDRQEIQSIGRAFWAACVSLHLAPAAKS